MNKFIGNIYKESDKLDGTVTVNGNCMINACFGDSSSSCTGNFCGSNQHSGCWWFFCGTKDSN